MTDIGSGVSISLSFISNIFYFKGGIEVGCFISISFVSETIVLFTTLTILSPFCLISIDGLSVS